MFVFSCMMRDFGCVGGCKGEETVKMCSTSFVASDLFLKQRILHPVADFSLFWVGLMCKNASRKSPELSTFDKMVKNLPSNYIPLEWPSLMTNSFVYELKQCKLHFPISKFVKLVCQCTLNRFASYQIINTSFLFQSEIFVTCIIYLNHIFPSLISITPN